MAPTTSHDRLGTRTGPETIGSEGCEQDRDAEGNNSHEPVRSVPWREGSGPEPEPGPDPGPELNPELVFETFITDARNRFPVAAAQSVAQAPGNAYNPLFIYGGHGVGKTHLLHAVGNMIHTSQLRARLGLWTGQQFSTLCRSAVARDGLEPFRDRFQCLDVLLLDDIQAMSDEVTIQKEFAAIVLALYSSRRQVVLAADRAYPDLGLTDPELTILMKNGLMVELRLPDIDGQLAMIKREKLMQRLSSRFHSENSKCD